MMDPLSALSIAANVVQFVEFGYKITRRLSDYHKASPDDVPRSMQTINTLLPLVLKSLERIKSGAEIDRFDIDGRCMLRGVIAGCSKLCQDINSILDKVTRTAGESVPLKAWKALRSLKQDDKIEEIGKSLQAYVQVLILYHVVESKEVPSRTPDEGKYSNIRGKLAPGFIRREALVDKLDTALADVITFQRKKPQIVVLSGPSGVGKTQFALDYCLEAHKAARFQTVFWLVASDPENLRCSLEDVAATVLRSNYGSQDSKIDFVKEFFGERWHPWLLVLDGFSSAGFTSIDLWSLLPQKGCGGIVLTTVGSLHDCIKIKIDKWKSPDEVKALQEQLRLAVRAKNLNQMKDCVENGADINVKNSNGDHYIIQAADGKFIEGVQYLLGEGADPEPTGAEESVMSTAVYRDSPELLGAFLDFEDARGTRLHQRSYDKALEKAVNSGSSDCCRKLMARRGVQLSSCSDEPNVLWNRAANTGHVGCLKLLEEAGLRPRNEEMWFDTIRLAIWGPYPETSTDTVKYMMTIEPEQRRKHAHRALCLAIDRNQTDVVQMLLESGCNPNLPDDDGHVAMLTAMKHDNEAIMHLLLDHGALPAHTGSDGASTYVRAYRSHSSKTAIMVIESMTPETPHAREFLIKIIKKSINDGGWELALATCETAERLGHKEAVLGCRDDDGRTPLAQAIDRYGDLQFTRFFIKQGSDLDVRKTSNGDSIMHMAVRQVT